MSFDDDHDFVLSGHIQQFRQFFRLMSGCEFTGFQLIGPCDHCGEVYVQTEHLCSAEVIEIPEVQLAMIPAKPAS